MENEKGDELLLPRAWQTGERTAVGEDTEASEQLDAQRRAEQPRFKITR